VPKDTQRTATTDPGLRHLPERVTVAVHVDESNRGYLGTGTIDFEQFFAALRGIGYQGIVTFESFSSAVVSPTLSNTLAVWRNLWDDGEDLARAAHRFMLDGLAAPAPTPTPTEQAR
jgi:D-psicose/D-tagatose/L-ribulose 3-epimerase